MSKFAILNRTLAVVCLVSGLGFGFAHAGEVSVEKYKSTSDDNYPIDRETYKKLSEAFKTNNKTASVAPKISQNPIRSYNTEGLKSFENTDGPQL